MVEDILHGLLQLPRLTEVTDYESFLAFVKKERRADPNLSQMLRFIPDLKWSLDESLTTIGYVYHQVSELHVLYSYSNCKASEMSVQHNSLCGHLPDVLGV